MSGQYDERKSREAKLGEAAAWRVRLTEMDADTSPEFECWLADPANAAAWERISHSWDFIGQQAHDSTLIAARRAALGDARRGDANRLHIALGRRAVASIAAALVLCALGWAGLTWSQRPDDFKTTLGERRVITLPDGSRISLDASSEVTVRYTKHSRELRLLQGQARFDVAHDKTRPFSVLARNQKVIATGTAFNIDIADQKVVVTLIEGHVVVFSEDRGIPAVAVNLHAPPRSVELKVGEQLAAVPAGTPEIQVANIQRATAWTNGQIMFDNEALLSVVARVNRYSRTQIVIDDPRVGAMRISGVLNTGDVAGFVDIVTHYLPVRAVSRDGSEIFLESQANG